MHRLLFLGALLFPGAALADSGCPILFYPGTPIGQTARICSTEGGLLVRQGERWECRDKWRGLLVFAFELAPKWPKVVNMVSFYPQSTGKMTITLNGLLDATTKCLGFEPEVLVMDPKGDSNGLVFRWGLKNGLSATVQELNRLQNSLLLEIVPTALVNTGRSVETGPLPKIGEVK